MTYESERSDEMFACAMTNQCITFGKLNVTCPVEMLTKAVEPGSSLKNLEGEWWQQYGKNAIYDCYPCQHIHENKLVDDEEWCGKIVMPDGQPVAAPCWSYKYSYDVFVRDRNQNDPDRVLLKRLNQTWQLPGPSQHKDGTPIDIYYQYLGTMHNETWYVIQSTQRYVALGYCSYMNGWTNVGAILWTKAISNTANGSTVGMPEAVTLTEQELVDIKYVYADKLGWDFQKEFCKTQHGVSQKCTDSPAQSSVQRFELRPNGVLTEDPDLFFA